MSKKRIRLIVIVIIAAVVICVGAIFGVRAYNDYIMQQQIEERTKDIEDVYAEFEEETDRETKLKILSDFIIAKPSTADEISSAVLEAIEPLYIDTLTNMRQVFIGDYNTVIDENTFSEADISEDREKLLTAIDALSALGETVEDEKSIVFFSDSTGAKDIANQIDLLIIGYRQQFVDDYNAVLKENIIDDTDKVKDKDKLNQAVKNLSALKDKIESEKNRVFEAEDDTYSDLADSADDFITMYQNRVKAIEKVEREAEEATKQAPNNSSGYSSNNGSDSYGSSDSDYSSSSSNSSNSDSSSDSSSGGSSYTRYWGYEGSRSYFDDRTGQAWDDNGNTWNFWDIQLND